MINKRKSTGLCCDVTHHTRATAPPEQEEQSMESHSWLQLLRKHNTEGESGTFYHLLSLPLFPRALTEKEK